MGTGGENTSKTSKPLTSVQVPYPLPEIPATPSYPDWPSSMQAFYGHGATPPPFFPSTVASPTPHPFMWGSQHPLIPPYGTPYPYPTIYPHGTVFAHPNMAMAPNSAHANADTEGRVTDGNGRASARKYKGTSGLAGGKLLEDTGKAGSGSGNDGISQSADSVSEGSSDNSDDKNNQQESTANIKGSFHQMLADGANAENTSKAPSSTHGKPVISAPMSHLNIDMDLWNAPPAGHGAKMRQNTSGVSMTPNMGLNDQWVQNERELKRQKRKQSNRESARRSRLRKQAECEELQKRVEALGNENQILRDELQMLSEKCEKLTSENSSIKEELEHLCGPDAVANL